MLFLVHYSVRSGGPWTPRSRFPPPPGDAPAVGAYGSTFLGMIFSTKTLRKIHGLDVLIALSALHGHEASMSDRLCFALGARLTVHFSEVWDWRQTSEGISGSIHVGRYYYPAGSLIVLYDA